MGSEGMAGGMWRHVRRKPFGNRNVFYDSPYAASGEPAASLIDQKAGAVLPVVHQDLPANWPVYGQRRFHRPAEGYKSFLLPFSSNQHRFGAHMNIIQVNSHQFGIPDTASIEKLENQGVALRQGRNFGHVPVEDA